MDNQNSAKPKQDDKTLNSLTGQTRSIHVTIKNKGGVVLDDDVRAVTSYNSVGIFDVLPLHTHFITLIKKRITIRKGTGGRDRDIDIGTGLMKVDDNKVDIYVGLPDPASAKEKQADK